MASKTRDSTKQSTTLPGLRVIVTGKGGVGKTTFTTLLARNLTEKGFSVLAIDADPQEDLASSFGYTRDEITPITKNRRYIEEKMGGRGVVVLNPDLSDLIDRCGKRTTDGIGLLVMGTVDSAGGGCLCPENTLIRGIIRKVRVKEGEVVLMDTPAGLEHLGRGLGKGFSHLIALAEPTTNALKTACRTAELAGELGISDRTLVINKVRSEEEYQRAITTLGSDHPFTMIRSLPYDDEIASSDLMASERRSVILDGISALAETIITKKGR
ncbi:AAA family ATPase [Methanocalculus sp.]|uniref:ATP-binding protein n=1 Tax=Methanocalculus sp. TaxID=2004547 RepID=UPI00271E44DE|nr:AAA family ATPase [Methanocalculus sp.]MDO8841885.1 AAA family ATPase [Methanocalculus sp.]